MSSAKGFMRLKNSAMVEEPFCTVANAMYVLMTRPRDWDTDMSWMTFHTLAMVEHVATCTKISMETDESR
jgi:hypothetical protein